MGRREQEHFVELVVKNFSKATSPQQACFLAFRLIRLATRLQRYATHACNYPLTPRQAATYERTRACLQEIATLLQTRIDTSGDPRGYVVKVHLPDGAYNTWGGVDVGYGVPTR